MFSSQLLNIFSISLLRMLSCWSHQTTVISLDFIFIPPGLESQSAMIQLQDPEISLCFNVLICHKEDIFICCKVVVRTSLYNSWHNCQLLSIQCLVVTAAAIAPVETQSFPMCFHNCSCLTISKIKSRVIQLARYWRQD